ncbi:MAG: glycosyltransferase family 2 protein [Paludibacteraceae bacterium]|nr:glycosyltransferase family 2 protein [Paludibacteraceae bacterium]
MQKLLTIVIPMYNMQDYLHRCLDSLILDDETLMQQLEVLVINDGSKDNSSVIAHEYEAKYPNTFRVIDKENGNYGSCINRGLKEAKGKYIKVLDADDWFDTNNFEIYLHFLTDAEADLVISDFDQVKSNGEVLNHIHYGFKDLFIKISDLMTSKLFLMHAVAYRTENLRHINYHQTEGISYTDQEWIFLPMTTVNAISYFGKVVYKYRIDREGQTMDASVFMKNFSHEMNGTESMMQEYEVIAPSLDKEHMDYLTWRLRTRIHLVYSAFLLKENVPLGMDVLKTFDVTTREKYPLSYKLVDDMRISKRIPIKFIHSYRRFYSRNTMSLMLYRLYVKMRFII